MSRIAMIAAMDKKHAIGIDNKLPWRLPDDLQHFKQLTLNKTIVMGRKTWESLPGLLPNRRHVVISRNKNYQAEGAKVVTSIEQAIDSVPQDQQVMVVGGANLYEQFLPIADTLYLTLVDTEVTGDAFFPTWDANQWQEIDRQTHDADDRHLYAFDFVEYKKVKTDK